MDFAELYHQFSTIVGENGIIRDQAKFGKYCQEPRGQFGGDPAFIVCPENKFQISKIMQLAFKHSIEIIPQGGNTGLVGAQQSDRSRTQIILSLEFLNKIYDMNKLSGYIWAEAGVVLHDLQQEADSINCLFPLNLASKLSCQLGGNLSTNAGGISVLSYGTSRDLCLGLEVVLPDGRILNDLRFVKKDNSGYSLKDLFIGAEGTLGIITSAVMKLFPKPKAEQTAYVAFETIESVLAFFEKAQEVLGPLLTSIEFMTEFSLQLALDFVQKTQNSSQKSLFSKSYPYYILLELVSFTDAQEALEKLEQLLTDSLSQNLILNAILAKNNKERLFFWHLRESMSVAQKALGLSLKNDISIPLHHVPIFLRKADSLIEDLMQGARLVCFGHMGDGNLHYNVSQPKSMEADCFRQQSLCLQKKLYDLVIDLKGAFSAEHGIGQLKIKEMLRYKSGVSLALMSDIKQMIDPQNILNPNKILELK